MNRRVHISFRQLAVVFGLIVSLTILSTTTYDLPVSHTEVAINDQTEDSQEGAELNVKSFDILNSSAQIELDHQLFVVREIEEDTEDEIAGDLKKQIQFYSNKAFKVLFQRIIGSNSP